MCPCCVLTDKLQVTTMCAAVGWCNSERFVQVDVGIGRAVLGAAPRSVHVDRVPTKQSHPIRPSEWFYQKIDRHSS